MANSFEKNATFYKQLTSNDLIKEIQSFFDDFENLKSENIHLQKYVEEANLMISKYEL